MPKLENRAYSVDPEVDRIRDLCAAFLLLQLQAQANEALRDEIAAMKASHSWRITEPLRRLRRWLSPPKASVSALQPAAHGRAEGLLADPTELLLHRAAPGRPVAQAASPRTRQLLVDVTELACEDHGAGVQRVVHRVLSELLIEPPAGFRVEPVRLAADGSYVYARAYLGRLIGLGQDAVGQDIALATHPGDQFLGLDLIRDRVGLARDALLAMKAQGVSIAFVVYDVLPLQRPDWFPEGMSERFREWVLMVAECSDKALCISNAVCREFRELLVAEAPESRVALASFPLGADLETWLCPVAGLPRPAAGTVRFLMVGTVELRKGHAQALDAFEQLWASGADCELVIAGKPGWLVPDLIDRLRRHPEAGRRLHWIQGGGDASLLAAYRDSSALLAPSWGEGFGLPLVEAASHGLPILARDLAVFREVAGTGADYFSAGTGAELAAAIENWLRRWREGDIANPRDVSQSSWRDSADALKTLLAKA